MVAISGGKSNKDDKDSYNEDERRKKTITLNSNADKRCNHCKKNWHMEADCWKKFPDKIPKKVKAARKKQEEKKTTAMAAVETRGDDVILGAIDWDSHVLVAVDIRQGYNEAPVKESMCTLAILTRVL